MQLMSSSFGHQQRIPEEFAFGVADAAQHLRLGANRNPHLAWSGVPAGTRSLVLLCVDSDVPTRADDVNKEGRIVPASLQRADFYHWVMVDIPPSVTRLRLLRLPRADCARQARPPAPGITPGTERLHGVVCR